MEDRELNNTNNINKEQIITFGLFAEFIRGKIQEGMININTPLKINDKFVTKLKIRAYNGENVLEIDYR